MVPEVQLVFCDDIRREDNGKLILIGVYAEDLVPGALPSSFAMSVWIRIQGLEKGSHSFKLKFHYPNERNFMFDGNVEVNENGKVTTLVFAGFPVELQMPGEIRASMQFNDEPEFEVSSLPVRAPWERQVKS